VKSGETLLGISDGEPSETDEITGHDREAPVGVRGAPRRRRPGTFLAPLVQSRWAPVAVLVAFGVLLSVAVWPGHLDADALKQIQQARTGHFNNWWAPIIDWVMRGLFLLGGGPGIVVAVTILTVLLSLYELLRARLSRWHAALATILVAVSPPVLGYLTALQRDVWFGASTLLSYALLVKAVRSSARVRLICAGLSLVADWFAMAARQNAIPALIPAVAIALLLLVRRPVAAPERRPVAAGDPAPPRSRRPGRRPLLIALLTVVVFGAFYGSQDVLTYHVIGAQRAFPQQELFEQDLAGISLREGVDLLPRAIFPAHNLSVLRRYYRPGTVIPLVAGRGHPLITYTNATGDHELEKAWEHAVVHHPVGYFHARWNLWMAEIDWNTDAWAPYHPGIDTNSLGLTEAFPVFNHFILRYLEAFGTKYLYGGVITKAWIYLLISPFLGLSLIRRRRSFPVRIIGFTVLGAFVYTLTFAVAAMADTFRWNWFLVTVTIVGLVVQAAETFEAAVARRAGERALPPASGDAGSPLIRASGAEEP